MKKLFENTWALEDQGVRIFLLAGEKSALVIDTGMTAPDIHGLIPQMTGLPYRLLNTHADRDHISGNFRFEKFYMHPSEAAFYYNTQGGKGRILPVFEGDVIDLGNRELEVIHLPGHTPGSITLLDRNSRCLIGGDPIQEDGNIYMFGPQRDFSAYIASLERLEKRDDFDFIYPSHAKEKVSREVIPQLIDGARRILAGGVEGHEIDLHGRKAVCRDVGIARFLCNLAEA